MNNYQVSIEVVKWGYVKGSADLTAACSGVSG